MKWKTLIIGIIIGAIFAGVWLSSVDLEEMVSYWQNIDLFSIFVAGFLYLLAYFFRGLRWKTLLSPIGNIKAWESFQYLFTGNFVNYLIPIRAGEAIRSLFLKKKYKMPISSTLSSVFVDKIFDTFGILFVLLLIPFLPISMNWKLWTLVIILLSVFLVGLLFLFGASIFPDKIKLFIAFILRPFPDKIKEKIHPIIDKFIAGLAVFQHHRSLLTFVLFWTFCAVLCDGLFFWFVFRGLHQHVAFLPVLFGYTLIFLSYILPQPPAQIGTNEGMMILIFSIGMKMNAEMVSAVMTLSHLLTAGLLFVVGSLCLLGSGVSLIPKKKDHI